MRGRGIELFLLTAFISGTDGIGKKVTVKGEHRGHFDCG